ncbi:MAG: dipeptidase, partial [Acidobacteriota bacterium]
NARQRSGEVSMALERREFLKALAAGAFLPYCTLGQAKRMASSVVRSPQEGDIDRLFDEAIVIDCLAVGHEWDDVEYAAVKESGYTGIHTTLPSRNLEVAVRALAEWNQRIRHNPDRLVKATHAADIERAKGESKLGVVLGFQNATMLEGGVENLDVLHELGTRCIQLTYNSRNLLGDGCTERTQAGLSDFGVAVVERMNELGIIVDLSHCGAGTTEDAIELSHQPPAFTHTFCEAIHRGHPRAKTDEQIKALAEKGGVIGLAALGYFVGSDPDTSIGDYLNHIDHAVQVAGIEHVGLSTDFQIRGIKSWATRENWYKPRLRSFKPSYHVRWPPWIDELDEPKRFRNVARGLSRRGYRSGDVEKILGLNWLRYFRDIFGA